MFTSRPLPGSHFFRGRALPYACATGPGAQPEVGTQEHAPQAPCAVSPLPRGARVPTAMQVWGLRHHLVLWTQVVNSSAFAAWTPGSPGSHVCAQMPGLVTCNSVGLQALVPFQFVCLHLQCIISVVF